MGKFNYRREKALFDREWSQLEKQYSSAGMAAGSIAAMKGYDWNLFNKRRSWRKHEDTFTEIMPEGDSCEDLNADNLNIGHAFSSEDSYALVSADKRFSWLNEITNPELLHLLNQLSEIDLIILTYSVFEGKSQKEISLMVGTSQQAVSKKLVRIKKFLKHF